MVKNLLIIIALLAVSNVHAQFATARLSKKRVLLEQPVKVTITAYSPTWFAEPLTFNNLQLNGAFIQSFSRTVPGIRKIKGKQYAVIEFYYILFPYKEGELIFPELTLTTSIPPEGDYKGRPVTLKTKAVSLQVDPVPSTADAEHWLVANNASIHNHWSADLKTLKVGDVVKRKITIKAAGTLPSFIDEADIGTVDFASVYGTEPQFIDDRDDNNANGRRIDAYSYLLEKEGTFTIPEVQIKWWNPYAGKYYSRKLPAYEMSVSENPDMTSMQHLKDSLNSLNQAFIEEEEEAEVAIDYMSWAKMIAAGIIGLLLLRWLVKIGIGLIKKGKQRRKAYLNSEAFWFNQAMKQKGEGPLLNALYKWLDRTSFGLEKKTLSAVSEGDEALKDDFDGLQKGLFSTKPPGNVNTRHLKEQTAAWRKSRLTKTHRRRGKNELDELNP